MKPDDPKAAQSGKRLEKDEKIKIQQIKNGKSNSQGKFL